LKLTTPWSRAANVILIGKGKYIGYGYVTGEVRWVTWGARVVLKAATAPA